MTEDQQGLVALIGLTTIGLLVAIGFSEFRRSASTPSPSIKRIKIEKEEYPVILHQPSVRNPLDGTITNYGSSYEINKSLQIYNDGLWGR